MFHLLEKSKNTAHKPSIVVLEAREACSGATGRNGTITSLQYHKLIRANVRPGGHLKPDPFNRPDALIEEFGVEAAAEAVAFEAEHVDAIKELVEKENIDCDFIVTRAVDVQFTESTRDKLKAGYDRLVESGVATAKGVFFTSGEKAEAVSSQV